MRKKWLYFFIVLVLVIVVLYLWRYNQSQVFKNRVPATATKVVNVNLRQIENHLLFDFLRNPITYLKPRIKKDSIKEPRTSLTKGVRIPVNVFFYTNADDLKNAWLSSVFNLSDKEELFGFLQKENFKKSEIDGVIFYTKDNFVLAVKEERLIIAFKTSKKADIKPLLATLFDNKSFLAEDAALLKPLLNNKSDISFSSNNDMLEASFSQGFFELHGTLSSDLFIANGNHVPDKEGILAMSGRVNKDNAIFKQFLTDKKNKFNEITHLSLDSIVNKWNGKLNMNITSIEQKIDTIVSYEYDDDFNKVEVKSTQEKKIPTLFLTLGQETPSSLSDYFYRKNAIQIIDNDTVFTTIPVFKFLATDTRESLVLRVDQQTDIRGRSSTSSKLNFYFNAEKYMQIPLDIPLKGDQEKFLKLVKTTNLVWAADNHFSLKIGLKDKGRNFLGKLLKQ